MVGASKKVHNTNFNNSRSSLTTRSSPFDDSSSSGSNLTPVDLSLPGFPDPMGLGILPDLGADSDLDEEDNPGDWPRLAAEQFLYDLIDQLDLGETAMISSTSTTSTAPSTTFTSMSSTGPSVLTASSTSAMMPSQPSAQWYSQHSTSVHQTTENPAAPSTTARSDPLLFPNSLHSSPNTNQNAATMSDVNTDDNINKMLAAVSDDTAGSDVEENLFARIYSDDDFIPRSVSMFDDEESYSPPKMPVRLDDILLSTGKSKAQRCLFGQSLTSIPASIASPVNQNTTPTLPPSERESDSCSDCEAEQHGLTTALRRELAEANEAVARPVVGPDSWLEMNRSFTTSVRDSGEGYSITTTQTQGARVVVTGLNYNDKFSCENESRDSSEFSASTLKASEVKENTHKQTQLDSSCSTTASSRPPFHQLQMLCLSNASVSHWDHLKACTAFPTLNNIRLKVCPYIFYRSEGPRDIVQQEN